MKPPLSHMNLFEFYQESTEEQSDYFKQKSNLSFSFGKKLWLQRAKHMRGGQF